MIASFESKGLDYVGTTVVLGAAASYLTRKVSVKWVNLASPQRTTHILYGDLTGGGHKFGLTRLFNGKTKFPIFWSKGKIMHAISEVATNPQ